MILARSIGLFALAMAVACGGNGGGGPGPTATQIAKMAGDSQVASAGAILGTPFSVVVRDQAGSPVAGVTVNWAVANGGGSIAPASSPTDANGVASATRTLGPNAGTQTATATRSGLSGSPVTFTAFSQIQGATSLQANGGSGQSDTVLSILGTPLSVIARDYTGTVVPGVTVNWSGSGGATPDQTAVATNGSGLSAITLTLGATAGPQAGVATVTGLVGSPVSIAVIATAGNATQMALNGGNNQTGCVSSPLPAQHSVIVRDAHGNPKPGVTVTWVGDGSGSVSSTSPTTGTNGVAAVTRTLGPGAVTYTDTAKVATLTGSPVIFTATGSSNPSSADVTVGPGIVYSPTSVTICPGGTVHFTWASTSAPGHSVSWATGPLPRPVDSATMTSGTYDATLTTPGTYTYICAVHGSLMTGTVIVQ